MILGTMLGPPIAQRIGPAYTIAGGLVITVTGMLLIYLAPAVDGLLILITGFVLDTIGIAPTVVLGTDLVVGSAPPEKAGSAASLSETCNQLGIALGVAALGSIASVVYRSRLSTVSVPEARESIIGALSVAGKLPGKQGTSLLIAAREAFTSGVHVVALTAAVVFAFLVVLTFITLGKKRAG
jgi:DHA2 family multidrug resistance protein-like MFS transporter